MADIAQDLELVDGLLRKDRGDARRLGLERLAALVDVFSSGIHTAVAVARSIVLRPANYRFLWSLIVDRVAIDDGDNGGASATSSRGAPPLGGGGDDGDDGPGAQRSIALRVLANALTVLELHDRKKTLEARSLAASVPGLLPALLEDLATGPGRPPGAAVEASGVLLAGPHEATFAIRCLRCLGVPDEHQGDELDKDRALRDLERARVVGLAAHAVLEREARECYLKLTEDDRSC
jgi:hypothetical protein